MKDKRQRLALSWPYWDPTIAAFMQRQFGAPQFPPHGPPFLPPGNPFIGLTSSILTPAAALDTHALFHRPNSLLIHPHLQLGAASASSLISKTSKAVHTCSPTNYFLPPHIAPLQSISTPCIGCLQQPPSVQTIKTDLSTTQPSPTISIPSSSHPSLGESYFSSSSTKNSKNLTESLRTLTPSPKTNALQNGGEPQSLSTTNHLSLPAALRKREEIMI